MMYRGWDYLFQITFDGLFVSESPRVRHSVQRAPFGLRALFGVRAPFTINVPLTILGSC